MKTIIIPTDFSPIADNALDYGLAMAKSIQASVLLLHVYQVPVTISDTPIVLLSVDELKKAAEDKLHLLKQKIETSSGITTKIYTEAHLGNLTDELELLCEKIRPLAIVMGSKGTTGVETVLFGSNTLTVIRHLKWPVICVPPGKKFGTGIKKIGFACDFNHVVETTPTHFIKEFVKTFGAELHVLNIDFHNRHFKPETPEESLHLHLMLEELSPSYHFIENKSVEEGVNQFADQNHLDLLVVIPKKHKLLEGLFKSSPTKQLVFHSHVPVMCVHED